MRTLELHIDDARVGTLRESDDRWSLEYQPAWRARADAFDLAPSLPRAPGLIEDGATQRPVQWFFDNLLPEESLRVVVAADANIVAADAFGLLEAFGAESAGALTLVRPGEPLPPASLRALPAAALSARIAALPRKPLAADAPKRMSLAGAQHKLAVVRQHDALSEPVGAAASTDILKPDHAHRDAYPHTVANEWFVMSLATRAGLAVPRVDLLRVPEPVYLVERFDRVRTKHGTQRLHAIDACQLLGVSRAFKYREMSPATLGACARACRPPLAARQQLFRWLAFNVLVGNNDAHLKNVSFLVGPDGAMLAPFYDLLATALYPFDADRPADVDAAELPMRIGDAARIGDIRASHFDAAAREMGLAPSVAARFLRELVERVPGLAADLLRDAETIATPGELRVLRMVVHNLIGPMAERLS